LVGRYEQSKSLPLKDHGSWPFFTKINATVAYSLGKEYAIALWKKNKAYYKFANSESLKVYIIDVMTDQRYFLQNRFIDSRPLIHSHSK
jgi:hypothetical protein